MRRVNLDNPLDVFLPEVPAVPNQENSEGAPPLELTGTAAMSRVEDGASHFKKMSDAILVGVVGTSDNSLMREAATLEMQRRLSTSSPALNVLMFPIGLIAL